MKKNNLRSIAILCSSIIMALSGIASFKIENLPFCFTFQNMFAIFFAALFGGMQGASVSGIVLLCGVMGLPVFSHFGRGMEVISGPQGGFLLGYFVGALLTGYFTGKPSPIKNKSAEKEMPVFAKVFSGCFAGFVMIEFLGIIKFFQFNSVKLDVNIFGILTALKFRYYVFADLIKLAAASLGAYFLRPVCAKYFYDNDI